jgi:hypothetical protein
MAAFLYKVEKNSSHMRLGQGQSPFTADYQKTWETAQRFTRIVAIGEGVGMDKRHMGLPPPQLE